MNRKSIDLKKSCSVLSLLLPSYLRQTTLCDVMSPSLPVFVIPVSLCLARPRTPDTASLAPGRSGELQPGSELCLYRPRPLLSAAWRGDIFQHCGLLTILPAFSRRWFDKLSRCQRLWLDRKIKLNNAYVYDWYQLYLTTLFHSKFTHLSWPAPCPWARLLTLITLCPRDRALSLSLVPACLAWPAGPVCPRPARPRLTLTLFYQTLWMHVSEFLWVNTAVRLLQVRAPGTLKTTVRKHREEGKLGEKSRKVVKIFCKTDVI